MFSVAALGVASTTVVAFLGHRSTKLQGTIELQKLQADVDRLQLTRDDAALAARAALYEQLIELMFRLVAHARDWGGYDSSEGQLWMRAYTPIRSRISLFGTDAVRLVLEDEIAPLVPFMLSKDQKERREVQGDVREGVMKLINVMRADVKPPAGDPA